MDWRDKDEMFREVLLLHSHDLLVPLNQYRAIVGIGGFICVCLFDCWAD